MSSAARRRAIGLDIGGTKILGGVINEIGTLVGTAIERPTPAGGGSQRLLRVAIEIARELDGAYDGCEAVGIGAAGVISPEGKVFSATGTIANWKGADLRGTFAETFSRPVITMNDVHAAALGEARCGAGRDFRSFLMVTVGTGIGGAICRDGLPDVGASGTAGSLGHIAARTRAVRTCSCGQTGHIEAYASGTAIERDYASLSGNHSELRKFALADDGHLGTDARASDVITRAATLLGVALADAMNLIDVEAIVLGGGVAEIGPRYIDLVRVAYADASLPGPAQAAVCAAELGTRATLIGAGLAALVPTRT